MFLTNSSKARFIASTEAIMIEMLGVHIGDDGDGRRQLDEGTVALIRLDHHPITSTQARIGAVIVDDAAIDDRGIEPTGFQECGHQRGRGGLAMGPADGNRPFEAHEFAQHLGAAHHGQPFGPGRHHFRVVRLHRRGDDHDGGVGEILGAMADLDRDTFVLQPLGVVAVGEVRAAHLIAKIVQDLGNAAHANAADADEMDDANVEW